MIGYPLRTSILVALALAQVGELSFVLANTGLGYGILNDYLYQLFLAVSILTMVFTPFIIASAHKITCLMVRCQLLNKFNGKKDHHLYKRDPKIKSHIIIVGYGMNGKNVSRAASHVKIPYLIIDMNANIVQVERTKGEPIFFGDATQQAILEHAGINDAKILVIAISDLTATRRITELAKRLNPNIHIIVRTRYIQELKTLSRLGADEVIPEEFETSVEIFSRVLDKYLIPRDEIEKYVAQIRADNYKMFRSFNKKTHEFADLKLHLPDFEMYSIRIAPHSQVANKTLLELELRKKHGVNIMAVRRNEQVYPNPSGDMQLLVKDIVLLVGLKENINKVKPMFE